VLARLRDRLHGRGLLVAAVIMVPLLVLLGAAGRMLIASPSPSQVAVASPTPTLEPTAEPTATPEPTPEPTPTPTPRPEALDDGRLTVLFLGSDDSAVRQLRRPTGDYLTDAITVISIKANGSRMAMFSLPRDTVDLQLGDGSVWSGKVNSLSYYRGPEAVRDAMAILLGIPIDHYVQLDMDDFRTIVRATGSVRVRVPYSLFGHPCTIEAGRRWLDAEHALCYARHRYTDSDYARAGRHQELLLALRNRFVRKGIDPLALLDQLDSLRTDVPMSDVPAYADLVRRSRRAEVSGLVLAPPTYTSFAGVQGSRGWISIPNVPAIQAAVADLLGRR
jgi:LCP family protein required for cell wall assembly